MKLAEVGNAVQPFENLGGEEKGMPRYSFTTTNGDNYTVFFRQWQMDPADVVELFAEDPSKIEKGAEYFPQLLKLQKSGLFPTIDTYDLTFALIEGDDEDEDIHFGIMNRPNNVAYEVFATVRAILVDFMSEADFDAISFSASEPSRQKLYDHFADMIVKHLDFNLIKGFDFSGDKVYFVFDPLSLEEL